MYWIPTTSVEAKYMRVRVRALLQRLPGMRNDTVLQYNQERVFTFY